MKYKWYPQVFTDRLSSPIADWHIVHTLIFPERRSDLLEVTIGVEIETTKRSTLEDLEGVRLLHFPYLKIWLTISTIIYSNFGAY